MRVLAYRHESGVSNFGDALNLWLWDRLLPQAGSVLRPDLLFLGIGTLLNDRLPPGPKLVFGAGAGYGSPPKLDASWDIRFVRGPVTAKALGLDPSLALTDPAILVGLFHTRQNNPGWPVSFMPRWTNVSPGLARACDSVGVHLINPRGDPETIILEIADSGRLITEALHGAIVADALRVPWAAISTEPGHEFKWIDWLSGLEMDYVPTPVDGVSVSLMHALAETQARLSSVHTSHRLSLAVLRHVQTLRDDIRLLRGPFAVQKEDRPC